MTSLSVHRFAVWNAWKRRPQEPFDEPPEQAGSTSIEPYDGYAGRVGYNDSAADGLDAVVANASLPVDREPTDVPFNSDGSGTILETSYGDEDINEAASSPPLARPALRRTTSLPDISLGERSDPGPSPALSAGKYTYRQEDDKRRRSMWEASGWTFVSCGG